MKKLLVIALILGAAYWAYPKYFGEVSAEEMQRYSLRKIDQQPIPKRVFFAMLKDLASRQCSNAQEEHNLSPQACREKLDERDADCRKSLWQNLPDPVSNKADARQVAVDYASCAIPYYFCQGVEVRSEEEVRRHCP